MTLVTAEQAREAAVRVVTIASSAAESVEAPQELARLRALHPAFDAHLQALLRCGTFQIGQVSAWKDQGSPTVLVIATRTHPTTPPMLFSVERSLEALARWMEAHPATTLSMPAPGGDALSWITMAARMKAVLASVERQGWVVQVVAPQAPSSRTDSQ